MIKIAHIINPVKVDKSSDLYIAQPITFETMRRARDFARNEVAVELISTQFVEDLPMVPEGFTKARNLERSVLDNRSFIFQKKLPLLEDILDRLYECSPEADYLIYTNVDIALMPYFYMAVKRLIGQGYDAITINRYTISDSFSDIMDIPLMYAEVGEPHGGYDCFVFKRSLYPAFFLNNVCIGASRVGNALLLNLLCHAANYCVIKNEKMTFHIGNDEQWKSEKQSEYFTYNTRRLDEIIEHYDNKNILPEHKLIHQMICRQKHILRQSDDRLIFNKIAKHLKSEIYWFLKKGRKQINKK